MEIRKVVIIGSGISGLTAAIYNARSDLKPLVITGKDLDQLSMTTKIENFPGFPNGIMGMELVQNAKKQAQLFGAEFLTGQAESFKVKKHFEIIVNGKTIKAYSVIIATGASHRMLGLDNEKKYLGRGVSTCATCDAALFRDKTVAVVGGGDSAMEEAMALSKFAKKIYVIHRRNEFRASKIMQERVLNNKKVQVIWDTSVIDVLGNGTFVTGLKLKNLKNGKESEIKVDGMFLGIGLTPNTKVFEGIIELDEKKYIKADGAKTNIPGVFAAGDVADPIYRQAITSAGSGCEAALEAEKYLNEILY